MADAPQPPHDKKDRDEDAAKEWSKWSRYGSLAVEFLGYLLVMGYAGWWLDQRYGWKGHGLFWGLILGLVAWLYRVLKQTWHLFK